MLLRHKRRLLTVILRCPRAQHATSLPHLDSRRPRRMTAPICRSLLAISQFFRVLSASIPVSQLAHCSMSHRPFKRENTYKTLSRKPCTRHRLAGNPSLAACHNCLTYPMVGIFAACCAPAPIGHAAAPPSSVMNVRRLIGTFRPPRTES